MSKFFKQLIGHVKRITRSIGSVTGWLLVGIFGLFLLFIIVRVLLMGTLAYFGTLIVVMVASFARLIGLPPDWIEPLFDIIRFLQQWATDPPCDRRGRC